MQVNCEFRYFEWIYGSVYTCFVTSASIKAPKLEINSFKGNHLPGKSDDNVKGLWFKDALVEYVPRRVDKVFSNLTHLRIMNCGLKEIFGCDFVVLGNLEHLDISGNHLASLPENLLLDMTKLRWIYFDEKKLQSVNIRILESVNIKNLEYVKFSNTRIHDLFRRKLEAKGSQKATAAVEKEMKGKGREKVSVNQPSPLNSIKVPKSSTSKVKEVDLVPKAFHYKKFADFFVTGEFSDFTIKVNKKEFKVHKCILAAQSPVFHRMFKKMYKEVEIVDEKAYGEFLRFLYTGEIKCGDKILEIYELAIEFEIFKLKIMCEEILGTSLSSSNALQCFKLAHQCSSKDLKVASFKKIKKVCTEISDYMFDEPELVERILSAKKKFDEGSTSHTKRH